MASVKKKKRRVPIFYGVLGAVVVVLSVAAALGLRGLYDYLADFESSQPKYVAEEIAKSFLSRDFGTIYELAGRPQAGQVEEVDYVRALDGAVADPISYEEVYVPSETQKRYVVYGDGKKFAAFTLKTSGTTSARGFDLWTFDQAECYFTMSSATYTIRTDPTAQVYVNDNLLDESCEIKTITESTPSWLDENEAITREYLEYTVTLYGAPPVMNLRVETQDGQAYPVEESGENVYQALLPTSYDQALQDANTEVSVMLAEKYAEFMSGNLSKKTMLNYCVKNTALYKNIDEYDTRWFASSVKHKFEDVVAKNFAPLNENAYSCEVSFTFHQKNKQGTARAYPTAYRLYIVKSGDKWRLYNVELMSAPSEEGSAN